MAKIKRRELSHRERKHLRAQQIVFIAMGVVIILSMVIGMVVNI